MPKSKTRPKPAPRLRPKKAPAQQAPTPKGLIITEFNPVGANDEMTHVGFELETIKGRTSFAVLGKYVPNIIGGFVEMANQLAGMRAAAGVAPEVQADMVAIRAKEFEVREGQDGQRVLAVNCGNFVLAFALAPSTAPAVTTH